MSSASVAWASPKGCEGDGWREQSRGSGQNHSIGSVRGVRSKSLKWKRAWGAWVGCVRGVRAWATHHTRLARRAERRLGWLSECWSERHCSRDHSHRRHIHLRGVSLRVRQQPPPRHSLQ